MCFVNEIKNIDSKYAIILSENFDSDITTSADFSKDILLRQYGQKKAIFVRETDLEKWLNHSFFDQKTT